MSLARRFGANWELEECGGEYPAQKQPVALYRVVLIEERRLSGHLHRRSA
jgi:hypothetical protein